MNIPESMKKELGAWNNGKGIDMDSWISCEGNYSLAVGYTTIFCPNFIEYEDYIFSTEQITNDFIQRIREFENQEGSTPKSVEWVLNHIHISDLHHNGCKDLTADKIIILGNALKNIYEARLNYIYPNKPCVVEFYQPDNTSLIDDYQLSFWQLKHEHKNT